MIWHRAYALCIASDNVYSCSSSSTRSVGGEGVFAGCDRGAGEACILSVVKCDSWLSTAAQLDDETGLPAEEESIECCGE